MDRKFTICLTGGIASGKTMASDYFASMGGAVIDTDVIAREVVAPGQVGLEKIVAYFGSSMLDSTGSLDRVHLKSVVFDSPEALNILNAIMHPLIRQRAQEMSETIKKGIEIWVIPLFNKNNMAQFPCDRVLMVDVKPSIQTDRVMNRDSISLELSQKIVASQPSRKVRLDLADDVVTNNRSVITFKNSLAILWSTYLQQHNNNMCM